MDQNDKPNPAVKYLLCSPGFNVQLRQTGFSYDTYTDEKDTSENYASLLFPNPGKDGMRPPPPKFKRHFHRVDIELDGCNPGAVMEAEGKSAAYYNYLTAGTPKGGVSNVHSYTKVTYKNIYPHIDLEFFASPPGKNVSAANGKTKTSAVEYNFIVHPGGNPADIRLAYKGANKVGLKNGQLIVHVSAGDLAENIPYSYIKNTGQAVKIGYDALGNDTYGFSVPSFSSLQQSPSSDLIIDPIPNLNWATYLGDSSVNYGYAIALSKGDSVYIAGYTASKKGIATTGAYQTIYMADYDVIMAEFNSTGSSLIWGTYYGGGGADFATSIAIDKMGNIYITGNTTSSSGIATIGTYQSTIGVYQNAFIAKFNSTGTSLLWGTYYGMLEEGGNGITVDASGNVYITGSAVCTSGIATTGAYQTTRGGSPAAFVAKFNATGNIVWGTYYGQSAHNFGEGIALDASDNVYITGYADDTIGIATAGAYQTSKAGGGNSTNDAFVAKFNSTGSSLVWGTYYGGRGNEEGTGIAVDKYNNVYITGWTSSTSGIATTGAHQTTLGGDSDAFIAKFNPTGTSRIWGTYFGGSGVDEANGIVLDTSSNIYIVGDAASSSGIAIAGGYQTNNAGGVFDAFIAKFNSSNSTQLWGTYFGGSGKEQGFAITLDVNNNVYITGLTNSSTGIVTPGAYLTSYNAMLTYAVFVAKFGNTTVTPLPITLTSFTATYIEQNNTVLTNWEVASQLNNAEFVVEKTTDGINYEEVASVPGAGTTPFSKSYSALDLHPVPGVSYYRLKQIDVDGNSAVFDPVAVFIGNNQNPSINVYPNPIRGDATLIYISTDENPLTIDIIDITGRTVDSFTMNTIETGENNLLLNTSRLSRGLYFIRATEGQKEYHLEFVKD